ncbi:MAG: ferritin family protein [Nanoarchaeota archaeon]|nr:ferritin family protein [Nanoarchaeota archaeon]
MEKVTSLFLIQKAIILERTRYNDYKKISRKVYNIEGKEVLIKLAEIERNHYRLLKNQIKNIKEFSKINLSSLKNNKIKLLKKEYNFDRMNSSISNDINIIENAENIERKDPIFYEEISKQTKDKQLKKVFQFLKEEENKHLKMLRIKLKDLKILSSKLSMAKDPRIMFYNMTHR